MQTNPTASIDAELREIHRRHEQATDEVARLMVSIAVIEHRREVLLERRHAALHGSPTPEPQR